MAPPQPLATNKIDRTDRSSATYSTTEHEKTPFPRKQLRKLATSSNLRKMLEDSRLQTILSDIALGGPYCAQTERLDQALLNVDFQVFANEVLRTVGVRDEAGRCLL